MISVDGTPGGAFERLVTALESADLRVDRTGNGAMAQCPVHDDHKPSLSIEHLDDRVLIYCHAGCTNEAVVDALDLTMAHLFNESISPTNPGRTTVAEFVYKDENGYPLFRVVRYDPKVFRQHRWNGASWDSTLGDARRVLYRLPELIAAVTARTWVLVVEGEKDAERLNSESIAATTIPMGANSKNWDKTDTSVLDGAYVAVIGDNDAPGRKYARHVANSLSSRASEVRLIDLPGLSDKGDVSDWLEIGNTSADLAELVNSTPAWQTRRKFDGAEPLARKGDLSAYTADSLRLWARMPPTWRIRGLLIKDTHLVVGASKKTLKTTLVSGEMAYSIANGTPWLGNDQFVVGAAAPVVVVINEGLKSYMRALDRIPDRDGAESLGPIYVIDASGVNVEDGDLNALIAETVQRTGAGLIIYDAWYGFVGGGVDASSLFSMADVFKAVQNVAGELGVDPVIVHHLKKNSNGRPDLDDLTFAGVAEWADSWMLITHRSTAKPDEGEYRLGLVVGSRQWGEINYEIDASFGPTDLGSGGYTQPPVWHISRVSAEQSEFWGKGSSTVITNPEPGILGLIAKHPYEYTKSQVAKLAPGGERNNRPVLEKLLGKGGVVNLRLARMESAGIRTRSLLALPGIDPAATEQQRLAPIGNSQPTNVDQGGAGNSPEAAVSASSEPPIENNLGNAVDVENVDAPTVPEPTLATRSETDQVAEEDVIPAETHAM